MKDMTVDKLLDIMDIVVKGMLFCFYAMLAVYMFIDILTR